MNRAKASSGLPSINSFSTLKMEDENGVVDYSVDTSVRIKGVNEGMFHKESERNFPGLQD